MGMMQQMFAGFLTTVGAPGATSDSLFAYVSMLLNGDGTNGAQNNTFIDSSTNNYTITRTGTPTQGQNSPFSQSGWSAQFSGTTYATAPIASTPAITSSANYTIEIWLNITAYASTYSYIVSSTQSATGWSIMVGPTGALYGQPNNDGTAPSASFSIISTAIVPLGSWHHVAMVRNNGVVTLYYDGTAVGFILDTSTISSAITYIGTPSSAAANAVYSHNGYLSNFRIVNGLAVYTSNFTPPTTPLIAISGSGYTTSLLTLQSNRFIDNSTNNYAITVTGATIQNLGPFEPNSVWTSYVVGGSMYFAAGDYLSQSTFTLGSGSFTVEGWWYIPAYTLGTLFSQGTSDVSTSFSCELLAAGNIRFYASQAIMFDTAAAIVPLNTWTHIAAVRNGTSFNVYVNGTSVGSGTSSATYSAATFQVNRGYAGGLSGVACTVSNFRVNQSVVYSSNFTPPTAPLTAIANTALLLSGTNGGITDAASKTNLLTVGTAQVNTTTVKYGTGSVKFNGSPDYLSSPISRQFMFAKDFTIEAWINQSTFNAINIIYDCRTSGSSTTGFAFYTNASRQLVVVTGAGAILTSTATVTASTWTHVAYCRTSGANIVYVNGVPSVVQTSSTNYTDGNCVIGKTNESASNYFTGYIDDFRITNGVSRYNGGFTPPTSAYPDNSTNDPYFSNVSLLIHANGSPSYTSNVYNNNTVIDSSYNALTLVRNGSATQGTSGPFAQGGWAGYFAGDQSDIGAPANIAFGFGTGDWTFECWVYPTANPANGPGTVFEFRAGATATPYVTRINASRQIMFYDGTDTPLTSQTVTMNAWNHVAWVKIGTTVTGYVNGAIAGTVTSTVDAGTSLPCFIGANQTAGYSFNGYISNARVVKGLGVYTGAFTVPTSALTATQSAGTNISAITGTQTSLLTLQNARFMDNSANKFAVTGYITAATAQFSPFNTATTYSPATNGGSLYFNGSTDYHTITPIDAFVLGASDWTFELWVNTSTFPTYQTLLTLGVNSSTNPFFCLNGSSPLLYYNATAVAFGPTIVINTWNHIAFTCTNQVFRVYTNGVAGTPAYFSHTFTAGGPVVLGANTGFSQQFTGYMADIRLVNGTSLYSTNFTPPTAPPAIVPGTVMLLASANPSAGIIDAAGKNDIVTVGTAATQTSVVKYGTGAMKFDGGVTYLSMPSSPQLYLGTGDFTVEAWVYFNSTAGTYVPFCQSDIIGGTSTTDKWFFALHANTLNFGTHNSGSYNASTPWSPSTGQWYHIAVTRTSGTTQLYINGTAGTMTGGASGSNYVLNQVGVSVGTMTTPFYFNGYIDDLRITKGYARYSGNFTAPTAALPNSSATDSYFNYTSLLLQGDIQSVTQNIAKNNIFLDNSTNNLAFTSTSTPTQGTFTPFDQNGWSGYFGGSDYISLPNSTAATTAVTLGTGDFTMEWWQYSMVSTTYSPIIRNSSASGWGNIQWYVSVDATGTLIFVCSNGGGNVNFFSTGASTMLANQWQHIAIVRSSGTWYCYVNGVSKTLASGTGYSNSMETNTTAQPLNIGGFPGWTPLTGYISNFRLVKGVVVYTGAFTPPTAPLTATQSSGTNIAAITGTATSLLTLQNSRFIDNSTNNFALTVPSSPSIQAKTPFAVSGSYSTATNGGSMYFNGTNYVQTAASSLPSIIGALSTTSTFTIESWIYNTQYQTGSVPVLVGDMTPASGTNNWALGLSTTGQVQFYWYSGGAKTATGNTIIPLNTWAHIAISVNNGAISLFVNGVSQTISGLSSLSAAGSTTGYLTIGLWNSGGASYGYYGYASNLRIVNGTALYSSSFTPSTTPLTAVTNTTLLLGAINGSVIDNSGTTDIVLGGTAQVGAVSKFGNGALMLNGSTDYANIPHNPSYVFGTSNFTIECWFNTQSVAASDHGIISKGLAAAGNYGPFLISQNGSNAVLYMSSTGSSWDLASAAVIGAISVNTWYHIALVRNGNVITAYLNGNAALTISTAASLFTTTTPILIGANNGVSISQFFTGFVDDVRITSGVARYTGTFTPPTAAFPTN